MNLTKLLIVFLVLAGLLGASGCTESSDIDEVPEEPDSPEPIPEGPEADGGVENDIGSNSLALGSQIMNSEPAEGTGQIQSLTVNITSEGKEYPAYTASPAAEGNYSAIVLIHSFNGLEQATGIWWTEWQQTGLLWLLRSGRPIPALLPIQR
ncbi:hypothetical protein [Methanosarcina horonobensis]|uniref:hypothetical protein n=1 Tax=Methanosarcina horonobensis TaxID=418008 RepID=UPI000A8BB7A1|nr:hypothetical protein [Methanosarcina horonobensis]